MLNKTIQSVSAYAPATCANSIVGFDILGLAIVGVGDEVTLTRRADSELVIQDIQSRDDIPLDPQHNIVTIVIAELLKQQKLACGFDIILKKGIPLSSGMGGSAASAVAALVACNAFLNTPLPLATLANYALLGEAKFSGQAHADNIVPALYGGLTLITEVDPLRIIALPLAEVMCVLIHPHLQLLTRVARGVLAPTIDLKKHSQQSAYLAGFISAIYQKDFELLQACLQDIVIEPQRAHLVPGFVDVKQAALAQGALGVSLSGAGPSVLAFARNQQQAETIAQAMQTAFQQHNIHSEAYLSPINQQGAHVI